jgi:hypothetical protein
MLASASRPWLEEGQARGGTDRTFPRSYVIARQTFRPVAGFSLPDRRRHCPQRGERAQVPRSQLPVDITLSYLTT